MRLNTQIVEKANIARWQLKVGHGQHTDDLLRPSCYLGAMRPLMPTFISLLPYLYDWTACYAPHAILVPCVHLCLPLLRSHLRLHTATRICQPPDFLPDFGVFRVTSDRGK